jgi:hypothetical protein
MAHLIQNFQKISTKYWVNALEHDNVRLQGIDLAWSSKEEWVTSKLHSHDVKLFINLRSIYMLFVIFVFLKYYAIQGEMLRIFWNFKSKDSDW